MAAIDLFQDCPDDAIRNRLLAIKELKEFHGEVAHPSIAKAHIDLAETLASHKQYEDANMQYDEAIRVYEKSFYTRNIQEIATALYNKAHVFMDKWDALSDAEKGTSRNELMSAIKLLQEALKIISLVKEVKDQAHQKKIEELKRKAREEDCKMDRPLIEACRYYAKAFNQYFVNDEAPVTAENHNHVNFLNEDQASSVSHKHSAVSSATVGGQESPNEVRGYQTGQRTGETHLPNTSTLQIEIEVGDRVEDQPPAYSSVILENASIVDFTRKLTSRDERASTVSIAGRD
ncbi:uncharacterized protein BJ171DRAFT_500701 [Polychytrium aggregatum]|uniref:uncharacterized protein n=1 Tax=Polychytrium aggregatum TaxID=110093 RepID=UPI0022FDEB43|nr:uncharacterized protein BJ171DRAFT_500701 [Polychytrium aggregatum]KAI9205527.1 hypothetical protein BJ171DRAFT_500701 [Polychytrium aggregatum]